MWSGAQEWEGAELTVGPTPEPETGEKVGCSHVWKVLLPAQGLAPTCPPRLCQPCRFPQLMAEHRAVEGRQVPSLDPSPDTAHLDEASTLELNQSV